MRLPSDKLAKFVKFTKLPTRHPQASFNHCLFLLKFGPYFYGFHRWFPPSQRKTSIIIVVDRLSKYSHFMPLKHPYAAASVAQLFFESVLKLHGRTESIVCDSDALFTSCFWQKLVCKVQVSILVRPIIPKRMARLKWQIEFSKST